MIDRFRRRPNERDREAIEREISRLRGNIKTELWDGLFGAGLIAGLVWFVFQVVHIDEIWNPRGVSSSVRLAEACAVGAILLGFAMTTGIKVRHGTIESFDLKSLRRNRRQISEFEAALLGDVHVLRCDATEAVAYGDDAEYPVFYAFQAAPDRVLFVDGLADGLPNSSFELVSRTSNIDDFFTVHCLGKPLRVRRLLPTGARPEMVGDEFEGTIDDLTAAAV